LADASADVVLLLGPLYHLVERTDRIEALHEARRILRPDGVILAAGISRFASAIDGAVSGFLADPAFRQIVDGDLTDGQHRNPTGHPHYFTTAFFHRPEELLDEVREAGFTGVELLAVEGIGWAVPRLEQVLDDDEARGRLLDLLRRIETEPALLGASPHLLAVARPAPG
jgi:SAM-dependent methyltransferase